ncbi:tetratricopeptide repeat protein [Streptomyces sp. NPDC097619]|uniref:tetratricopeptide repeat protein n=1 Tax=Streptomyces sp. NPDC097619 TaxID=3157228 RepID=UPI00332C654C
MTASPNDTFRRLRGSRSPAEFAALVRRAARDIGETVSCDARYIGRVEAGEIRCPNYAYERVLLHMFPGRTLADLGFAPRESVRGRGPNRFPPAPGTTAPSPARTSGEAYPPLSVPLSGSLPVPLASTEESDVLRRAFISGGTATVAAASLGSLGSLGFTLPYRSALPRRAGEAEVEAVENAVRQIRLLDDRHGADGLYRRAAEPLRTAYALLDAGTGRQSTADRLHAGAGELAISVGWLAHDSGRYPEARSHYAEALATARLSGDPALEAHAFCNTSFLARDCGRPREAVRAAQAGLRAARPVGSDRLTCLLTLREAGGWASLGDRTACQDALGRAHHLFGRGPGPADPEWMSFFGEAELEAQEARCWSALGEYHRAARHAGRAATLQDPHFARNVALYTAQQADALARAGAPDEAAAAAGRVLDLLPQVQSARVGAMLDTTTHHLAPHRGSTAVADFLTRRV